MEVIIRGLEENDDARQNVQKALALPYGLVQDSRVNTPWLEQFAREAPDRTRLALEPFGYYKARIGASLETAGENAYRVVVHVEPGEPVRVASASVGITGPGSREQALQQMAGTFPLRKEDILLQPKYEAAKSRLKSRAVELGYLEADFSAHEIEIDPRQASARIVLTLDTGPRFYFGDVRFEGAPRYPEKFLHRYLAFKTGEVFSYAKLGETQLNLVNSDRFKEVFPVAEKDKAADSRVPVLMRMAEAPTKRLRPGTGYGTDIGPRFTLEFRDLNVFDRGHEFRSELDLSGRLQNLGAEYRLPDAVDINSFTGLQINFEREDVTTYRRRFTPSSWTARKASAGAGWAPPTSGSSRRIRRSRPSPSIRGWCCPASASLKSDMTTWSGRRAATVTTSTCEAPIRPWARITASSRSWRKAPCFFRCRGACRCSRARAGATFAERGSGKSAGIVPLLCGRRPERARLRIPVARPGEPVRPGRGRQGYPGREPGAGPGAVCKLGGGCLL